MMNILSWLVALLSCIIGTICGMGGGIIIKPVLDAKRFYDYIFVRLHSDRYDMLEYEQDSLASGV